MADHYLKDELYERVHRDDSIFEFLQRGSLDGIWYWDLENPAVEWMSPRFWEVLGVDPATKKHLASEWQDLIDPSDLELAIANFEQHCADPTHPYDQTVRYTHADGSTVWVRCRGMAIRDEAGTPIRMLGAHTDVTAHKRTELKLQAITRELEASDRASREALAALEAKSRDLEASNQALEHGRAVLARANEEIRQFSTAASHDLQGPLRAISGFAAYLEEDYSEVLDDAGRQYLHFILEGARRMQRLITDLRALSSMERGPLPERRVDMDATVRSATRIHAHLLQRGDLELTHDPLPAVMGDATQLLQLMHHLIGNAIIYRRPEPLHVHVGVEPEGGAWVFTVSDDGMGIAPRHAERVFRVFHRLHTHDAIPGSGVGLSMCRRIVERHGGRIWVVPQDERLGCEVRFTLPALAHVS